MKRILENKAMAYLYYWVGVDTWNIASRMRRHEKGLIIKSNISNRTGNIPTKPNLQSLIQGVKKEFSHL